MLFSRFRNAIDYPLRQLFRWRRSGYTIRNEDKNGKFAEINRTNFSAAGKIEERLLQSYPLDHLYRHSTVQNYAENLYYLQLLDEAFDAAFPKTEDIFPDRLQAADVGVSHWFYVQSLYAFLRGWRRTVPRQVRLEGYETDAYRIYADFFSRADRAAAHIQGCEGAVFIPRAFESQPAAYDLITLFFPFVFIRDHLAWGLPGGVFQPQRLLDSVWTSLKPGGVLLVVNQGEDEHTAQKRAFQQADIPLILDTSFRSDFFSYDLDRTVLMSRRSGA
jgi:hypothetical protein